MPHSRASCAHSSRPMPPVAPVTSAQSAGASSEGDADSASARPASGSGCAWELRRPASESADAAFCDMAPRSVRDALAPGAAPPTCAALPESAPFWKPSTFSGSTMFAISFVLSFASRRLRTGNQPRRGTYPRHRDQSTIATHSTTNRAVATMKPTITAHATGRAQFTVQPKPERCGKNRLASPGL